MSLSLSTPKRPGDAFHSVALARAEAFLSRNLPGVALCAGVSALAAGVEAAEAHIAGRAWIEALVLAILLGAAIRTAWTPPAKYLPGIAFSGKILLEIAVVLLGATISAGSVIAAGSSLLVGIVAIVAVAILTSYALGRALGLPWRMATLVACGNSICGNSAIAAVAPVIGADCRDIAASIAFTAVLGVAVVLGLPLLATTLHLSDHGYGIFAGLTVYAVPQVIAATAPVSTLSVQMGTLVKLVRVLMLGPVVLVLSLLMRRSKKLSADVPRLGVSRFVPWFIVGFLGLMAARSSGLVPTGFVVPIGTAATWLTIVSMAALGLGVDVRVVARAGMRVTSAVTLSLIALGALSLGLIFGLGLN